MKKNKAKKIIQAFLCEMDIQTNGERAWDINIHREEFYPHVLSGGSLALGESYIDGWWDCDALDQFFKKIFDHQIDRKIKPVNISHIWDIIRSRVMNVQKQARAFIIGRKHYDLGNMLFSSMLDTGLNYSCAYWYRAKDLDTAQTDKLDLICRKLDLRPGMTVLDIGCGWGGFARFAAENYQVAVIGITVSKEQAEYARRICKGLDVTIKLMDYRKLDERVDRVVSIGMIEHVGYKNYGAYMEIARQCLKKNGLFLLHTIGSNRSGKTVDPWIQKYIFPNSMLPSAKQILAASEKFFILEDFHNLGYYYDKTLMAWHKNFVENWRHLKHQYDDRFYRMWTYYLLSCAASFRARRNQLWQIVFSIKGIKGIFRTEGRLFV